MAARRKVSRAKKHGTRMKPMRRKASRQSNKHTKYMRKYYIKHRAKLLKKGQRYYRKNRTRILKKARAYRRLLKKGRAPLYKHNAVGGRYPRGKRLRRVNKYKFIGGHKRRSSGVKRRRA